MSYKSSLFMATKGFRTVYDFCDNPLFNCCQDRWSEEGKNYTQFRLVTKQSFLSDPFKTSGFVLAATAAFFFFRFLPGGPDIM